MGKIFLIKTPGLFRYNLAPSFTLY